MSQALALNCLVPASQTLLFPDPRPLVERLGHNFFRQLTERPGVYQMLDARENVLYIGKAKNLRKRLNSYRVANPDRLARRHLRLLRLVARIELLECANEAEALAKEAELLLALKPQFNRAGVWPATPRFLVWRCLAGKLELAVTETPEIGWLAFGPFGSGVRHLRTALTRLLWYALNPAAGSLYMPTGWMQGRLGAIVAISLSANSGLGGEEPEIILKKLFAGDTNIFSAWIGKRTKLILHAHDRTMRDVDLETVTGFMEAKANRTRQFALTVPSAKNEGQDISLPLSGESWDLP